MPRYRVLFITVLFVLLCFSLVLSVKTEDAITWYKDYTGEGNTFYSLVEASDGGYALAGTTGRDAWLVKIDAFGDEEWYITCGETGEKESFYSVIETSDGGYALAGRVQSLYSQYYYNAFLVKTDAYGNMEWNKTYGVDGVNYAEHSTDESFYSVIETSDGGYALAGHTDSTIVYPNGSIKYTYPAFWLVKTDAYGNMEWNQTYGGKRFSYAYSLVETSDGGYALAGSIEIEYSNSSDVWYIDDFWLLKTDSYGNEEWNQTYGGEKFDLANSLVVTSDGGYALAGTTESFDAGGAWLVKTDAYGNMEWNRTYEGTVNSLVVTSDGGYALAGQAYVQYWNDQYGRLMYTGACWLMKADAWGNIEWSRTTSGDGMRVKRAESLIATSDGGYAIVGAYKRAKVPDEDVGSFVIKTDENGISAGLLSSWPSPEPTDIPQNQSSPEPTPTPSPSSPSSTPTPDPTPTPSQEPQQIDQELIMGAAIASAVIVVFVGLLIYFIKRK